jgi:rhodanese-related sulfurtransferase
VACGLLRGDHPQVDVRDVMTGPERRRPYLLDVRANGEYSGGHLPGAVNFPLDDLRSRLGVLLRDQAIAPYCQVGQRGYLATRNLRQAGFEVANIGGGYKTYRLFYPDSEAEQ